MNGENYKEYEAAYPKVFSVKVSLSQARKQFEYTHIQYGHDISTYLDRQGNVCYTCYIVDNQWIGYKRALVDLDMLKGE